MTPRSFAARYLPSPRHRLADGGILAPCPACSTPASFLLEVDASGAFVSCSGRPDSESPCSAEDFARILDLELDDFTALLESVRPEGSLEDVAAAPRPSLRDRLIGRSALANLPTLEPLIADTVLRRTVNFVAGPPASGKSFHLLAWAAAVATGTPWQGRKVDKGHVLYLIAEGAYGVDDRLAAWEQHTGHKIPDDAFIALPEAVQLADAAALEELVDFVREEDLDLVIIDTLSRSAVGLDENNQADMSRFIAAADRLRDAMSNGSVVIAHHSAKSGAGLRGSSVIEGAADSVYVTAKGNGAAAGTYRLARAKNKYGPEDDFLSFVWQDVANSGVLVPEGSVSTRPDYAADRLAAEATWVRLLRALDHGQTFTRPEAWAAVGGKDTVSRSTFYDHITTLLGLGVLELIAQNPDKFRLDLQTAAARRLPLEPYFNPLGDVEDGFLDDLPTSRLPEPDDDAA